MDGSVASKGSEREAARPQRRGDCFVFAQPIRRPQLSSATVQAANNILDRGHQTLSIMHDEAIKRTSGHAPGRGLHTSIPTLTQYRYPHVDSSPATIAPIVRPDETTQPDLMRT
jgi:hypothetical protein